MFASFQKRYALSDKGVKNAILATITTTLTNLVMMAGIGFLFMVMDAFMKHLLQGAPLPDLGSYLIGLLVFIVALFITNWLQYTYTYGVVYEESETQRLGLAERLRKLPLSFFSRRDIADLTETMLTDVETMEHAYSHVLGELYGAIVSSTIVFLAMLAFNWQLDIAAFWSIPVAFIILFATRPYFEKKQITNRANEVTVSEGIQETLECVREIRATNQKQAYLRRLYDKIDHTERFTIKTEMANQLVVNSAMAIMRLGIPSTLLVASGLIAAGQLDFMVMFAFLLVVTRLYAPFDQALMLIFELFISRAAAQRMLNIYNEPMALGTTKFAPVNHDITFDHVGFSYTVDSKGKKTGNVLKDVSFVAREGEVTALVGPSGSGKSTCARLAARFWDASSGTVQVGGIDVTTVDPETLLRDYAVVFQDVLLFDDSVMGNIRIGRHGATDEEVRAAARAANCDEFVTRMPQGYDTRIGENGSKLSGGERQRISIARALLKDAPIVLLDEVTASLDVENETQVQEALSRLLAGKTVVVIAHRMRTVESADKVVVLKDGVVVEQGIPAHLLASGGEFAKMVELQHESANWTL